MVRIEPKLGADRPKVSFEEWDGMLRVCFNRRNKTLRASWLGTKEVLNMVERVSSSLVRRPRVFSARRTLSLLVGECEC